MRKGIIILFLCFVGNISYAADISFLGDALEAFKIAEEGHFWGRGNSCFSCSSASFAQAECPKHAKDFIKGYVKYGILGWFNDEEKLNRCFKSISLNNDDELARVIQEMRSSLHIKNIPSMDDFTTCFKNFDLAKKRTDEEQRRLMAIIIGAELYMRANIEKYKEDKWKHYMRTKQMLGEDDKLTQRLAEEYGDVVDMDSCFTSDINCHGASWTFRKVPKYSIEQLAVQDEWLSTTAKKLLVGEACIYRD